MVDIAIELSGLLWPESEDVQRVLRWVSPRVAFLGRESVRTSKYGTTPTVASERCAKPPLDCHSLKYNVLVSDVSLLWHFTGGCLKPSLRSGWRIVRDSSPLISALTLAARDELQRRWFEIVICWK